MKLDQDKAVSISRDDLAKRLGVSADGISLVSVTKMDFPDMSFGAPVAGEMSAMMIATGWKIIFSADDKEFEYRADKYQIRLCNFNGTNHIIYS